MLCVSIRRRHKRCALVTGVLTLALPICANYGDTRKPRRDVDGLRLGKRIGDVARRLACGEERSRQRLLVDMRGAGFEGQPGGAEHRGAAAALRGEEQCHAPARSSTSLITAAAVSSIERRVTSITGPTLSANIRRAKASSAFQRSSRSEQQNTAPSSRNP